jgi:hypothetical protein
MIRPVSLPLAKAALAALAAVLLFAGGAAPASADPFDHFLGAAIDPITLGLGGAVSCLGIGHAGMEANPASMGQIRQYALQSGYTNNGNPTQHGLHVSAADSLINPNMALGFSYAYRVLKRDFAGVSEDGASHRLRGALALSERWPGFQLMTGVTVGWQTEVVGPIDRRLLNVDAGILAVAGDNVRLGFSAANLVDNVDAGQPRELTGAAALTFERVQLGYDARVDLDSHKDGARVTHSVGAQIVPTAILPVRLGYRRDGLNETNALTGGISIITPRFAFDAAYGQEIDGIKRRWVALALRYFVRY